MTRQNAFQSLFQKKTLCALIGSATLAMTAPAMAEDVTLRMAYDADPVTLDIHEQLSGGTLQLSHMVYDPLIRWNKELGFDGRLAKSWERVDDNTMRFHLREGVKFHSGNDFTAKDVVWTVERLKKSADFKAIFAPFSEVKAVDDYTVELVTDKPFPLVLNAATYIFPMDSEFYSGDTDDGQAKDEIAKRPIPLLHAMCPAPVLMW